MTGAADERLCAGDGVRDLRVRGRRSERERGDPDQVEVFLTGDTKELAIPGGSRTVRFDALQRIGVGISRLGTSEATAIGAYEFALRRLGV